ncbi:MAG: ISNCY family transposase [Ketobacter sp.]|nr:ISNCY family transposase [Ketobacter sp.]
MRQLLNAQLQLGETDIGDIQFDPYSRDDIPQILRGLQYLYTTPAICDEVFKHLERILPAGIDAGNGRPGMELWDIFVLGTVRLNLNCDYDRVMELANEHRTLREILGHGLVDENDQYRLQTVKDNVSLLTREVLDDINQLVVRGGHALLGQADEPLAGRCDSSVVETDIHFPTDTSLLTDAMRKVIGLCGQAGEMFGVLGWRQFQYNFQCLKNLYRQAVKLKRSTSKDEAKVEAREAQIKAAHQAFMDRSKYYLERAQETVKELEPMALAGAMVAEIECYIAHAERQIDQIRRRVIEGETIPHAEKVFSVFEEHTEWISKGKAGVPVELGLRVCVLEDTMGFILHHQVMEKQTDDKVAVSMIEETQARFPRLRLCSFDKGFYTPQNREALQERLEKVVLPKKGKWSKKDREIETEAEFVAARKRHSSVESAINALEVHGLDRCPDHGIEGFKRYIALAIVARNIQKIGAILQQSARAAAQRTARIQKRAA